jgi:hypothetical protein
MEIAPETLRLKLISYGMEHPYRVLALEEIFQSLPGIHRDNIKQTLDLLAAEGLVTKFSSRYCFNRTIPAELRRYIERAITPSGTIRMQ